MKVFFISTLQKENQGGLFKATYEKIVRHESKINCYVVNNNYYDTKIIRLLKKKDWQNRSN